MPSGRKEAKIRKLFQSVPCSGKKKKVKCQFCHWVSTDNATRLTNHIRICSKCPVDIKQSYVVQVQVSDAKVKTQSEKSTKLSSATKGNTTAHKPGKSSTASSINESSSSLALSHPNVNDPVEVNVDNKQLKQVPVYDATGKHSLIPSLKCFVDRMDATEQQEITQLVARAIYGSGTPLSIVQSPLWKQAFKRLRPSYLLPGRYAISHGLLDAEYARVLESMHNHLASVDSVGLMCDGWSSIKNQSIVNFVLTTPQPVFYKSLETGVERHTAEYMAQIMVDVIEEVGQHKVFGIVTDNAANMKAAWKKIEAKFSHITCYGCVAHGLNLLLNDLGKLTSVDSVISNTKLIINEIKRSPRLLAIMNTKAEKGTVEHTLKLPVPTRWGSNVTSLNSMYLNKSHLQQLAVDSEAAALMSRTTKASILSDVYWDQVEGLIKLLKPIATWITMIEGDKPQISSVARIFSEISHHFQSTIASSPLTKSDEKKATEALSARQEFCIGPVHKAANLLDPKYLGKHVTEDDIVDAMQFVTEAATHLHNCMEDEIVADLANYRSKSGLWSKSFIWKSSEKVDPLTWWKGMCSSRPLAKVTAMILSLPATSAACERSFSTYGNIQTAKRNRLTTKRASKLVFISQNLKLSSAEQESKEVIASASDQTSEPVLPSGGTSNSHIYNEDSAMSVVAPSSSCKPSQLQSDSESDNESLRTSQSYLEFPEDERDCDAGSVEMDSESNSESDSISNK